MNSPPSAQKLNHLSTCTQQLNRLPAKNVGSTCEFATIRFYLLPSFYISFTTIESTYIPVAYPALRVNQHTRNRRSALDHPHSSSFIPSFKMEYSCLVSEIPTFIFTSPAFIIIYFSPSSKLPTRGTHSSFSPHLFPTTPSHPPIPLSLSLNPTPPPRSRCRR
jgi:hypothetical protein